MERLEWKSLCGILRRWWEQDITLEETSEMEAADEGKPDLISSHGH